MADNWQKKTGGNGTKRKVRSPKELQELELAGGEEGGMPAGSAGGPGEKDVKRHPKQP